MMGNRFAIIVIVVLFVIPVCVIDRNEAIESFQIHPDFQIELVAAEPVVFDPAQGVLGCPTLDQVENLLNRATKP